MADLPWSLGEKYHPKGEDEAKETLNTQRHSPARVVHGRQEIHQEADHDPRSNGQLVERHQPTSVGSGGQLRVVNGDHHTQYTEE